MNGPDTLIAQTLALACLGATLALTACEPADDEAPVTPAADQGQTAAAESDFVLASAPDGAVPVGELKKSAAEGDTVVVRGRIGGRSEPFTEGRAIFTIVDPALKDCSQLHGDTCPRPWDYCCEPRDSLLANSATVQIVGADGRPLALDVNGTSGIEPLAEVIVTGTVGPRPSDSVLVIEATGVHVVKG